MKLFTGGKAGVGHMNLIQLQCSGTAYGKPDTNAPVDGLPYFAPWVNAEETNIPPQNLSALGQNVGSDGNLWVVLPDNASPDLDLMAPGFRHYCATATPTKYLSRFDVFVCQPYPGFTYDGQAYGAPPPIGFPTWRPSVNAGHAWWGLSTEAPSDAVNQFTTTNCSQWLNQQVGYGANGSLWNPFTHKLGTAPGELPYPYGNAATVSGSYTIGFQSSGVIDGLNYTENLHTNPGTYNLGNNNCVIKTVGAGSAVGVTLPTGPNDWKPEYFGAHLPPNN